MIIVTTNDLGFIFAVFEKQIFDLAFYYSFVVCILR